MLKTLKKADTVHFWLTLTPLGLALLLTLAIFSLLKFLPSRLPLFYSLPWGGVQLATAQQFLIIPAIIILVTLGNLTIFWQLHPSQIFFKKILVFSPLIISLILTITFIKVVLIFI